jgi:acetylornithine deacetylase/succinyl-diaminopimelate desuccinylase-like protein
MDLSEVSRILDRKWDEDLLPRLVEYVKVPAKSPAFDPAWAAHGELAEVIARAHAWSQSQDIPGLRLEVVAIDGRTPCLYFEAPATGSLSNDASVLFYGHLDKQPEMEGWRQDLGPYRPVVENGRLYGRGSADDGYAVYTALSVIKALDAQGIPRPRCVGLIETCEESGSPDLPAYLELLAPRFGDVLLVAGLDSGCGNYDQLWVTTSLRGLIGGTLTVEMLSEGVHSGNASGIVPSTFRIARRLLNRLDDPDTGRLLLPDFAAEIPAERLAQAERAGEILGDAVWRQFPWVGCDHAPDGHSTAQLHAMPTTTDPVEGILNRTWRGALSVTGAEHLPGIANAGNVLRPKTSLKLSLRLPPTVAGEAAAAAMKRLLEKDPPYNARVHFEMDAAASGWNAPESAPWLVQAVDTASRLAFGKEAAWMGEGGTIPFMNMLGVRFPKAQFLITGVLGPGSNAHGPNEFLDIGYARKLSLAVASVVASLSQSG